MEKLRLLFCDEASYIVKEKSFSVNFYDHVEDPTIVFKHLDVLQCQKYHTLNTINKKLKSALNPNENAFFNLTNVNALST